ncbi:zinc ribbon domain-containing protein [Candidatus Saccharibacteria bacterium]|nr:zinc ribbon domain-containing protein [Candidatus Saccharibacteria bacterium]
MEEMIVCQSCHMPLTKTEDYGTNADGTASDEYCAYCFAKGEFIGYKTVEEAIADSVNYAEHAGVTKEEMLEYAKKHYPNLKRWKNS